jgi:hypothetical protein
MFERNLGVKIFMFISIAFLAVELITLGFFLDELLLEVGNYILAIYTFNSILLYLFAVDFAIKFFFKANQSMQISPYLTLPIPLNRLFNFLLRKEFTSFWNYYLLFLIIPFALKSITPFFGLGAAVLYIVIFYLACVAVGLLVAIVNNLIDKSGWFYILPVVIVGCPFALFFGFGVDLGSVMQRVGELLLQNAFPFLAGIALVLVGLYFVSRLQMRNRLYKEMQGEKADKVSSFSNLSVLDRFSGVGQFLNLELKMIFRAKRLKNQLFVIVFFLFYFFWQIYSEHGAFSISSFSLLFFGIFTLGSLGMILGQYLFMVESAYFDGLMSRKLSLFDLLKSKYSLYSSFSFVMALFLLIPVFSGKLDLLLLVGLLFYVTGPVYFLIFQNAVYNKTYFDLFEGGMMNWKGTSSNTLIVTMLAMFIPVILVLIIQSIFGKEIGHWFMIITGILFTFTSDYWLKWTYNRFLKRKYKNMEGFRSNA